MANVSSFSGTMYLLTNKNPWTPEGFIALYDVMEHGFSGCGGEYGVCLDECFTGNSAEFLSELMSHDPSEASMGMWGSGRWSAGSTFESFDRYTEFAFTNETEATGVDYSARNKLLKLMYDNEWYLEFSYTDEEGGVGFLVEEIAVISPVLIDGTLHFNTNVDTTNIYDYNLRNFSEVIDGNRDSDRLDEVVNNIVEVMFVGDIVRNPNKPDEDIAKVVAEETYEKVKQYILDNYLDDILGPYPYFDSEDDVPDKVAEHINKLKKDMGGTAYVSSRDV